MKCELERAQLDIEIPSWAYGWVCGGWGVGGEEGSSPCARNSQNLTTKNFCKDIKQRGERCHLFKLPFPRWAKLQQPSNSLSSTPESLQLVAQSDQPSDLAWWTGRAPGPDYYCCLVRGGVLPCAEQQKQMGLDACTPAIPHIWHPSGHQWHRQTHWRDCTGMLSYRTGQVPPWPWHQCLSPTPASRRSIISEWNEWRKPRRNHGIF